MRYPAQYLTQQNQMMNIMNQAHYAPRRRGVKAQIADRKRPGAVRMLFVASRTQHFDRLGNGGLDPRFVSGHGRGLGQRRLPATLGVKHLSCHTN